MAQKSFTLEFKGYWREVNKGGIPNNSGVYCVYTCTYNKDNDTVSIDKLVYIGESGDVRERIEDHEKKPRWKKHLKTGQALCYNFAAVDSYYRERVEAALIFYHKPSENTEYVDEFPFDTTKLTTKNKNYKLDSSFTVYKN